MKALPAILFMVGAVAVTAFVVVPAIPPKFSMERYDNLKKTGEFEFGRNLTSFSAAKPGEAKARNGYSVVFKSPDGKSMTFDLYKNGKFIKHLKTLWA